MKKLFRETTRKVIGASFDEATFGKAYAKAQRWARQAYGSADMQEYINEVGSDLSIYYAECQSATGNTNKTFNRKAF